MGGKRKSSSPQQAPRQIRFTMQMPSTPSSDSSCTPEKRQKKSDGLALREPGSHMELDAALDGGAKVNAADFMAQHVARPLFPTSAQSKLSSADLLEQQKAADAEQLQKNLDEQKHHKLPSADPLEQQDSEQPQKNLDEQKHRKLPSADPLEQQEATDSQQPQKKLDEQKHCKLPSADPLEQQEATDSEQPQKKLHEQMHQKLPSADPLEQQQTDSEQAQTQLDEEKQHKLPSADLEQLEGVISEQPQKKLDEEKHHKLPSADPLEQLEAAQSEQVQKKPPLSADLEAALVELRTFLPVPEYMTQQKSKTLGIFGPKP